MWTYEQFSDYLGNKPDRPIPSAFGSPRASRVERIDDSTIGIRYHDTVVVMIHDNGHFTLDTGGWRTVTTKKRINDFSPANVWQDKGVWYIAPPRDWDNRLPFTDGLVVDSSGAVVNADPDKAEAERERVETLTRQIKAYARGVKTGLKEGTIGIPSGGDCWECLLELSGNSDHLIAHLNESYYVPSLIASAIRLYGSRAELDYFYRRSDSPFGDERWTDHMINGIASRVTAYLKTALGIAR